MAVWVLAIVNMNIITDSTVANVESEREDTYQKELLVANWVQTKTKNKTKKTQNRASQLFLTASCSLHFREKPVLSCLFPTVLRPLASPYKGVPGILFQPIGLRLSFSSQSCAALSSSPTNQNGSIWDSIFFFFWTNQTARIWSLYLHEVRPIRIQGRGLLSV